MGELILLGRPSHGPRPAASPVSLLQDMRKRAKDTWARWQAWRRQRAALISLSDVELNDLAISRAQASFEANQFHWRS